MIANTAVNWYTVAMKQLNFLLKKHIHRIFAVSAAAGFAAAAAVAAALGVNIYGIVSSGDMISSPGSAVSYITEKVRECEDKSNIRTASLQGSVPALVISAENESENTRDTWIFAHDGYLKELTANHDTTVSAFSGKNIVPLRGIDFSLVSVSAEDSILQIDMTDKNGDMLSFCINLYGNGGAGND